MSRKKARDNAFKCVYELEFCDKNDVEKVLKYCYEENENTEEEIAYIDQVLKGVLENISNIDKLILSNLKNWTLDRIAKIDLAILRIAIFEIMYMQDIPEKVSVNEAVELAKEYGNNDSRAFVNGILAKILKDKVES